MKTKEQKKEEPKVVFGQVSCCNCGKKLLWLVYVIGEGDNSRMDLICSLCGVFQQIYLKGSPIDHLPIARVFKA